MTSHESEQKKLQNNDLSSCISHKSFIEKALQPLFHNLPLLDPEVTNEAHKAAADTVTVLK